MRNPTHQKALTKLLEARKPKILMLEPQCSLWSNSNTTMDPVLKEELRLSEVPAHNYMIAALKIQRKQNCYGLIEQPRASK
jgi:hypothetical protein